MKKRHLLILALLIAISLTGCQALQDIVKKPTVKLEKTALKSTTLFAGDLEFTFNVSNPNPIGARLDEFSYQLSVEGKKVFEGTGAEGISLPAMGSQNVVVPVTVNYMDAFDTLIDFFRKDSLTYEVSGVFKIGVFSIPFTHKNVLTLPKPPSVRIKNVSISGLTLTGAKLDLEVEVSSESKTKINMKQIDYSVSLGGFRIFNGKSENINIPENTDTKTIIIPISVNFLTLGKSAASLFTKNSIDYELEGNMDFEIPKIGIKAFPFKKTGSTGLTR